MGQRMTAERALTRRRFLAGASAATLVGLLPQPSHALTPAPKSLAAPMLGGTRLDASPLKIDFTDGRFRVVNFWATWCAPCRVELPHLQDLSAALAPIGGEVIAVHLGGGRRAIKRFLEHIQVTKLKILYDEHASTQAVWHVHQLPMTYVVDRRGQISHLALGLREWNAPEMIDQLRTLAARG